MPVGSRCSEKVRAARPTSKEHADLATGKFATVLLSLSNRKGRGYRECSAVKVFRGESEDDTARRLAKEAFFMRMTAPYNHRNVSPADTFDLVLTREIRL